MMQCAAAVYHPNAFTGQPKAVRARCGRRATKGSDFCPQHTKMVASGSAIERFDAQPSDRSHT
jgi:hypothetical protein